MALYNLTPHEITIYDKQGEKVIERIASNGELRLASRDGPNPPITSITSPNGVKVDITPSQEFTGLNENSPGFKLLEGKLEPGDQIIVSMVVAEYMTKLREYDQIIILCSGSSPKNGVRIDGQIRGTKALEYYAPNNNT
jgi:hypothetical protein